MSGVWKGAPAKTQRSGFRGERRKEWSGWSFRRQAETELSGISSDAVAAGEFRACGRDQWALPLGTPQPLKRLAKLFSALPSLRPGRAPDTQIARTLFLVTFSPCVLEPTSDNSF